MKNYHFLILLLIGLISCSEDENLSTGFDDVLPTMNSLSTEQLPCSNYEMLVFTNMDEFRTVMGQVIAGQKINDILGVSFYSLTDYYVDEGVEKIEDFIYDKEFASVLSPEGEIKIENIIYRVTNETVLQYTDCTGQSASIQFVDNQMSDRLMEMEGEIVESNHLFEVFIPKHEVSDLAHSRASESHTFEFETNKFLKGKMWNSSWFFYSSIGVETTVVWKEEKWSGDRFHPLLAEEVTVEWDVHFDIQPIASGNFPDIIDCSDNQCLTMCTSNVSDIGSKTKQNTWKVKHLFDWAVGISVTLSGGNFEPGVPTGGTAFNYWKHRDDQNCLSNHSAVVSGQAIATPTIFWKPCVEIEDVACEAPTNLKVENVSCGTYRLTILGEGNYSVTNWNNTNTSPATTQTSTPSLTVTVPTPGTNSRIKGSLLCAESGESQLFDFDFTRLLDESGLETPMWEVPPPYTSYQYEIYDIQVANPPLPNGDYDLIWEASSGVNLTHSPAPYKFNGKATIQILATGMHTVKVTYIDLCNNEEKSSVITFFTISN